MPSRSDLYSDLDKLTDDATQMADENDRLRQINAQMLDALRYSLPILQEGLPEAIDHKWIKEAIIKVQNAIAEAERD
jgi:hypothetical protein